MRKFQIVVNGTSYIVDVEELAAGAAPAPVAAAPAAPAATEAAPAATEAAPALYTAALDCASTSAAFNSVTIITPIVYTSAAIALYGISSTKKIAEKLLTYETSTMLSRLALDYSSDYTVKCFLISALIIILSLFIGYFSFTKRELE